MASGKNAADKITAKWATNHPKITPRKYKQLYTKYKTTHTTPTIRQTLSRPKKQITKKETIEITKQTYKKIT